MKQSVNKIAEIQMAENTCTERPHKPKEEKGNNLLMNIQKRRSNNAITPSWRETRMKSQSNQKIGNGADSC